MKMNFRVRRAWCAAGLALASGCVAPQPLPPQVASSVAYSPPVPRVEVLSSVDRGEIQQVDWRQEAELTIDGLVRTIHERNPTIEQMQAAAEAVRSRYPQVIALEDPMLGMSLAPGSTWSPNTSFAARGEITQKLPFPGKRNLRGQAARAEANAAERDVDDIRLQLAEAGQSAFADYYLAIKALEVSGENTKFLKEIRANAETRYRNGQAPQQDILQADVELAKQEERTIALQRAQAVARAKINTLMHQAPDLPLPPPGPVPDKCELPDAKLLREQALANRPDLKALSDRLMADEAALALAVREFKPDVELLAAYDGFWQGADGRPLQWQIGARINLPIQKERRHAAVQEAQARINQRRAELAKTSDQIMFQVQEASEQVRESSKIVALYEKSVLPAAQANVKEAQASYTSGKIPFLSLVEAQRNLAILRDRYYEAQAESVRRRGTLERVVGSKTNASASER